MRSLSILALFLWLAAAAAAQGPDASASALVRISGDLDGARKEGSGFVIGLNGDKATILTASHVVAGVGMQDLEVVFAIDSTESFKGDRAFWTDFANPNGLAVFQVRGTLPRGITTVSFEDLPASELGMNVFLTLLGYSQVTLGPRPAQRGYAGGRGPLLYIDQNVEESFSGGLVFHGDKIVGLITDTEETVTIALSASVVRETLRGLQLKLGVHGAQSATEAAGDSTQPVTAKVDPDCAANEERVEKGIVFVRICPGGFTMGSLAEDRQAYEIERPAHGVALSGFWIGKTEITNGELRHFRPDHTGEARLPATQVSWEDADAACKHFGGRLPTEAEWEYAARAGSQSTWSFGNQETMLGEYAWYDEVLGAPHPVGLKKRNAWGLHDMHGNVWEWVADWYGPYSAAAQADPKGPEFGVERVLRGGAVDNAPRNLRSASRIKMEPGFRSGIIGFRCALDPAVE